ncbi:uncharacterized protein LOC107788097 [Nicotiana tabacum]|uniref:Uncharacterized protein LOC107788097 n=1 Tax=Nicotiana tabacum TaxID=4097 RepID=A0AC58TCY0_TOBAC
MLDNTANTVALNTTGGIPTIDSNHAYFLHSADAPGMSLVNTAFDGKGFQGWRRSVLIALSAKNKIGFINGACPAPALTSRDYQPWSRCNDMVTSWLLNSLPKDIGDSVIYSKSAKDLWTSLEHRFGQSNGAKLYHMRKELSSYGQARGTILMMNPLPSINHAYSLVLQDESQKEVFSNLLISPDSSSFMATNQNDFAQRSARHMQRNQMQHQKFGNNIQKVTNSTQRNITFKGKKTKFNPNVTCSHCKKVGHTVSDCYRVIGFPEDFEFTKGNQVHARSNGAFQIEESDQNSSNQNEVLNQHLSHDQFSQLVQLIKQVKGADSGNSETNINANAVAGTIARYSGTCLSVFNSSSWIIDSGAFEHMCFDSNAIISLAPLPVPLNINLPNSFKVIVTHIERISILPHFILENVLHGLLVKRAQVFGKARDGLYLLEPSGVRNSTSLVPLSVLNQNVFSQLSILSASSVSDVSLWHIRLGHLPFSAMKHHSFISLPSNSDCFCKIYPKARQTRIPFPLSQIKSTRAFELIYVDVWGPYKESTYNGFKYFLTVVDDYSRAV